MRLIIASNNKDKISEIRVMLSEHFEEILSLKDVGIFSDPIETGRSFEENAEIKARAVAREICARRMDNYAVLGDDSGLCVDALGGLPGVYSARLAHYPDLSAHNANADNALNRQKLLELLKDEKDRSARFVCALVLIIRDECITVKGECGGEILFRETGGCGFGYDSLFLSADLKKSFGLALPEEKNDVSHRARALRALKNRLKEYPL